MRPSPAQIERVAEAILGRLVKADLIEPTATPEVIRARFAKVLTRNFDEEAEIELALEEPLSAITPGQSVVLYQGDRVLGGGVIERGNGARQSLPVLAA